MCKRSHPQRRAQPRRQAIEIAAGSGENGMALSGSACRGIDRDQRQIGLLRGNCLARRVDAAPAPSGHRDQDRGGLQLFDARAMHRPSRCRSPETCSGVVSACCKCWPLGGRDNDERALLGHLQNSDYAYDGTREP